MRVFLLWVGASLLTGIYVHAAGSGFDGRWRLDPARSTALDGWTTAELVLDVEGSTVKVRHDMTWRSTKVTATNVLDTAKDTDLADYFRIDQRHMAVYAPTGKRSHVTTRWLDNNRTLRVEAVIPLEVSQGDASLRTYSEYRLLEGDSSLLLIELQNSRVRPLVYHFTRVTPEAGK